MVEGRAAGHGGPTLNRRGSRPPLRTLVALVSCHLALLVTVAVPTSVEAPLGQRSAHAQPAPQDLVEESGDGRLPPAEVEEAYRRALDEEKQVRDWLQATTDRIEALRGEVAELETRIGEVQGELAAAEQELSRREAELEIVQARLNAAETRLGREQRRLREQAIAAYIGGGATPMPDLAEALQGLDSLNSLAKSRVYGEAVVVDRREVVERFNEARDQAEVLRGTAAEVRAVAAAAHDEVRGRLDYLAGRRAERDAAQQQEAAAAAEQSVLALELDQRRRAVELDHAELLTDPDGISEILRVRQFGQPEPAVTFGIFLNPVEGGRVVSGYGPRMHPILGHRRMHKGLDIVGPMGSPIRASADGVVVMAENRGGYGLMVVVDHGNRLATLYSHLNSISVVPGATVRTGDVLGTLGSTGLSTGPHCHWEVRVLGVPVNPTPYMIPES